jgi:hypothetical protein
LCFYVFTICVAGDSGGLLGVVTVSLILFLLVDFLLVVGFIGG